MFNINTPEQDPRCIVRYRHGGRDDYNEETIPGKHYRVFPTTAKEVLTLQMMVHGVEKHAPANGGGAIITAAMFLRNHPIL